MDIRGIRNKTAPPTGPVRRPVRRDQPATTPGGNARHTSTSLRRPKDERQLTPARNVQTPLRVKRPRQRRSSRGCRSRRAGSARVLETSRGFRVGPTPNRDTLASVRWGELFRSIDDRRKRRGRTSRLPGSGHHATRDKASSDFTCDEPCESPKSRSALSPMTLNRMSRPRVAGRSARASSVHPHSIEQYLNYDG